MPELPEVEILKRSLAATLINKRIVDIDKRRSNLRYPLSDALGEQVRGAKIINLKRRAKYLIIDLDNSNSLVIHLGMSGKFTLQPDDYNPGKHDHVIFHLDEGNSLVFNDIRRFGMIYCFATITLAEQKIFKALGPEPLSDSFTERHLDAHFRKQKLSIKTALMNNNMVVGVGNIYASESLFLAKIHPQRLSSSLTPKEQQGLIIAVKAVLEKAILAGGTTLRDFVNGLNQPGYFQQKLLVYGREDKKCHECSEKILKIRQSGRASFYCGNCQV